MSDHASGPRAFADPVVDITDMYVFPSPQRPGYLTLVMDVFPFAGPTAFFSDVVDYQFRIRPVRITDNNGGAPFAADDQEYTIVCRFDVPTKADDGLLRQQGVCTTSSGQTASPWINDEKAGQSTGLHFFAGRRMDPFFFDGVKAGVTLMTRKLNFSEVGQSTMFRQNVLSIVVEIEIAAFPGPRRLYAVVCETVRPGSISVRLERFGRPDVKNLLLFPKMFDKVNRDIELRDLYNEEDAFNLGKAYIAAYRSRMNSTLAFWDGLDGKTHWPLDEHGTHPLTGLFLNDFMVVDVSKPFAKVSSLEIEESVLKGTEHKTCGGRWLNDDAIDTFLTLMITGTNGTRISDGVDQATVPASQSFPYLAPPEKNPPPIKAPDLK